MTPAPSAARRLPVLVLGCALLLAGLSTPARASRVRTMTLEEMVQRAGKIVSGRCTAVNVVKDAERGIPVTELTFQVHRSLKGPATDTLVIRQPGDATRPGLLGLPQFRAGEEVLLLLYGESSSGLTSPVGLGQGKFTVITDKQGKRWAVNAFGNRNLLSEDGSNGNPPHRNTAAKAPGPGIAEAVLLEKIRLQLREHSHSQAKP